MYIIYSLLVFVKSLTLILAKIGYDFFKTVIYPIVTDKLSSSWIWTVHWMNFTYIKNICIILFSSELCNFFYIVNSIKICIFLSWIQFCCCRFFWYMKASCRTIWFKIIIDTTFNSMVTCGSSNPCPVTSVINAP